MGCTDCSSKGGCDTRKGEERLVLDAAMDRIYPDRTWGRPDDEARFRAGVPAGEVSRLRRAMAELLRAPTWFRDGAPDDLCNYVYVLCLGREPSLLEMRDGDVPIAAEADHIVERYFKVSFSSVARMAAVQETELTLDQDPGEGRETSGLVIREAPRAGVYEPSLLKRLRSLTALLAASDILYVDFGLLDKPVERAATGDYVDRFGTEPRLANFLFYAQPPTTATITHIPR